MFAYESLGHAWKITAAFAAGFLSTVAEVPNPEKLGSEIECSLRSDLSNFHLPSINRRGLPSRVKAWMEEQAQARAIASAQLHRRSKYTAH